MRHGRSLEGRLVLAAAAGVALFFAGAIAASIYAALEQAADRIAAVTQPR